MWLMVAQENGGINPPSGTADGNSGPMETLLRQGGNRFSPGRQGRIRAALSSYFQAVQALYENQVRANNA